VREHGHHLFSCLGWLFGRKARRYKGETVKQQDDTTKIAGVDVSKDTLDIAVLETAEHRRIANRKEAFADLIGWLSDRGVSRVGLEATGGYEHDVRIALLNHGFDVVVHQPVEISHFARFNRVRRKSDKSDAFVIAKATALSDRASQPYDALRDELEAIMTFYEHVSGQLAQCRSFGEHATGFVKVENDALIESLETKKRQVEAHMLERVRAEPALAARHAILCSIPGIGKLVALSLVIRMPELGTLRRGQAASLLGVAPYERDSGKFKGKRTILGGRHRPRRHMYMAALGAIRTRTSAFRVFAKRLIEAGKPRKLAIVAVMRKLIELANTLLAQNRHWEDKQHQNL
jgi:transposase